MYWRSGAFKRRLTYPKEVLASGTVLLITSSYVCCNSLFLYSSHSTYWFNRFSFYSNAIPFSYFSPTLLSKSFTRTLYSVTSAVKEIFYLRTLFSFNSKITGSTPHCSFRPSNVLRTAISASASVVIAVADDISSTRDSNMFPTIATCSSLSCDDVALTLAFAKSNPPRCTTVVPSVTRPLSLEDLKAQLLKLQSAAHYAQEDRIPM